MRPPLRPAHHPLPSKTYHGVQRYLSSVGGVAEDVEPEAQTGRKEARHQSKSSTSRLLGTRSRTRFPVISQLPWYCWYLLICPNPTVRLDSQVLGGSGKGGASPKTRKSRRTSERSATREACLVPMLAACVSQHWICRRLKGVMFESFSNLCPAAEIGCGPEDPGCGL